MTKRVFLASDERMLLHRPSSEILEKNPNIAEIPARVEVILEKLYDKFDNVESSQTVKSEPVFVNLSCEPATKEAILLAHSEEYYEKVKNTSKMEEEELLDLTNNVGESGNELYFCSNTFLASTVAVGAVVESAKAVLSAKNGITRAIAVVRPPGHHACEHTYMGFCFFNSVGVTAKYCIDQQLASKVVIIDWDVHHGNGTQDIVYNDPNIMYISLHRFGNSKMKFYPGTGKPDEVGEGDATGTNINIAWTRKGMGNIEYSAAFAELILPMLLGFNPDLVLVSCGFDAVEGDYIGDCNLSPSFYGCMTRSLLNCLGDKIPFVVALEGGYNIEVNAICMESITSVLIEELSVQSEDITPTHSISTMLVRHNTDGEKLMKLTPLEYGKSAFHGYWPQGDGDSLLNAQIPKPNKIQLSAIKSINKSIKAMQKSPISMENVSLNLIDEREASSVTTRRRRNARLLQDSTKSLEDELHSLKI